MTLLPCVNGTSRGRDACDEKSQVVSMCVWGRGAEQHIGGESIYTGGIWVMPCNPESVVSTVAAVKLGVDQLSGSKLQKTVKPVTGLLSDYRMHLLQ